MSLSHRWFSKLLAKWDELHPHFELLQKANVSIALLVNLHLLEGPLEPLDLLIHL